MLDKLKARLVGHGRITVRDLLLLVASVENRDAYLEKIFGWIFTRGSEVVKGALAGWIALAVGAAAVLFGKEATTSTVLFVAIPILLLLVFLLGYLVNQDISHVHREWLASVALLERLGPFKAQLQAYLTGHAEPDHAIHRGGVPTTTCELEAWLAAPEWQQTPEGRSDPEIGQYLFEALGPVPTVHYQASRDVRELARQVLNKAVELGQPSVGRPVTR